MDEENNENIKMDIDLDENDIVNWELEEEGYLENCGDEALLSLTPIVYTTKLDDMNALKRDLREFDAEDITEMIQSESKPVLTPVRLKRPSKCANIESYIKIASVVHHINFKARLRTHSTNIRNRNLKKQCKPLKILLKDIMKSPVNKTHVKHKIVDITDTKTNDPQSSTKDIGAQQRQPERQSEHTKTIGSEQKKATASVTKINELHEKSKTILSSAMMVNKTNEPQQKSAEVVSSESDNKTNEPKQKSKELISYGQSSSLKVNKANDSQRKHTEIVSSCNTTKTTKPPRAVDANSFDEDAPLTKLKTMPVQKVTFVPTHIIQEKYALIVLLHKREKAFIYRVNNTKLVTDYYITTNYNEYKLAEMYPKEEKLIEIYCCWFKREEIVTKICTRKNYPYAVQTFLRQPHSCDGDCRCCCYDSSASNQKQQSETSRRDVVNKALAAADTFVSVLLDKNQSTKVDLVNNALSYIPKPEETEKSVPTIPEKFSELLLYLKYTGVSCRNFTNTDEMYEIGKDGNVIRSFPLDKTENSSNKNDILRKLEVEFCCWYSREKLLADLSKTTISPIALKFIQTPHNCDRNSCKCCCKPKRVTLNTIETLPTILKHSTVYEKNARPLCIRFCAKSKFPKRKVKNSDSKSKKIKKSTGTSVTTAVLSNCASKEDKNELNTNILCKFKNVKLTITDGKLEAALNVPARELPADELQVLSETLALSTREITEMGITPEVFCKRINTASGQSDTEVDQEMSLVTEPEIPSPPLSPEKQNTIDPLRKIAPSSTTQTQIDITNVVIKKLATLIKKISSVTPKKNSNPISMLYASMSDFMAMKNTHYVHSHKSFFQKKITETDKSYKLLVENINYLKETEKKSVDSFQSCFQNNVTSKLISKLVKFPPIAKAYIPNLINTEQAVPKFVPQIANTFTVSECQTESSDHAIAGPSGMNLRSATASTRKSSQIPKKTTSRVTANKESPKNVNSNSSCSGSPTESSSSTQVLIHKTILPTNNDKTNTIKRKQTFDSPNDTKIRVKSSSELIAIKTTEASVTSTIENDKISFWPAPILIKQEPLSNIQKIASSSQYHLVTTQQNLSNNIIVPVTVVNNNNNILYKVTGNSLTQVQLPAPQNVIGTRCTMTGTGLTQARLLSPQKTIVTRCTLTQARLPLTQNATLTSCALNGNASTQAQLPSPQKALLTLSSVTRNGSTQTPLSPPQNAIVTRFALTGNASTQARLPSPQKALLTLSSVTGSGSTQTPLSPPQNAIVTRFALTGNASSQARRKIPSQNTIITLSSLTGNGPQTRPLPPPNATVFNGTVTGNAFPQARLPLPQNAVVTRSTLTRNVLTQVRPPPQNAIGTSYGTLTPIIKPMRINLANVQPPQVKQQPTTANNQLPTLKPCKRRRK